jgi:hypothetical protein
MTICLPPVANHGFETCYAGESEASSSDEGYPMRPKTRLMYIEHKNDALAGPARIGRVRYSKSGSSIHYDGKTFQSLKGEGFKANYFDVDTDEEYWISGCRKDGMDALYNTDVTIDDDVVEEYWTTIRNQPENQHITSFRAKGKYR